MQQGAQRRCETPYEPGMLTAFWAASAAGREQFGLLPDAASDERVIEDKLDLDRIMKQRELVQATLFTIYDAAHQVLLRKPPMDVDARACFRELAFWNMIRILAGFSVRDMAKNDDMAIRAKHTDTVWPHGLDVKMPGATNYVPAKTVLQTLGIGTGF